MHGVLLCQGMIYLLWSCSALLTFLNLFWFWQIIDAVRGRRGPKTVAVAAAGGVANDASATKHH
jgi:hypothetical protein